MLKWIFFRLNIVTLFLLVFNIEPIIQGTLYDKITTVFAGHGTINEVSCARITNWWGSWSMQNCFAVFTRNGDQTRVPCLTITNKYKVLSVWIMYIIPNWNYWVWWLRFKTDYEIDFIVHLKKLSSRLWLEACHAYSFLNTH